MTVVKKKFPLFVPYVTVFLNNFLHLLVNRSRCDVKLKPILIDCSVIDCSSLGSGFMHFPEHFLFVVVFFILVIYIKSTKKNGKSKSEFEESFTKPFIR